MSNVYYKMLLQFCDAEGAFLDIAHLYNDLKSEVPNPDSYRTLVKYYDADLVQLSVAKKRAGKKAMECWNQLKRVVVAEGVYREGDGALFIAEFQSRIEDCDFRAKVREWTRTEVKRASEGKTVRPLDFATLLGRYDDLVLKRLEREAKKKQSYKKCP